MPTPNFNFPTIAQTDTANVPRDLNALATALDTAFQQMEYQTATVVGTQIRVTKPSSSSRIFFRLANTINTGSAITISTDGGATSTNLVDANGANISLLEKGFTEIVKVDNFFILRSKGLSQAQLTALVNAIGAPAVATDSFDTIVNKLVEAKEVLAENITNKGITTSDSDPILVMAENVADIPVGKKFASGTVLAVAMGQDATIEVSGLNFTPNLVVVRNQQNSYFAVRSSVPSLNIQQTNTQNFTIPGGTVLSPGYFKVFVVASTNDTVNWYAYE